MPIHITLAAIGIALSIPVLGWTMASTRSQSTLIRRNLGPALTRPLAAARRPKLRNTLLPKAYVDDVGRRLDRGGFQVEVESYLAIKSIAVVVAVLAGGLWGIALGGSLAVIFPLVAGLGAWVLPDLQVGGKASARELQLDLQLPDVLDQLTISVEAGLGFDSALKRMTESSDGPVTDQLARVLQDMRLGLSRDGALKALAERTDSPDLRSFANSMAQAGRHGLPIASVLRAQAAEAREKRKFRAEERAHKVPVKILLPLILCVLPCLFIVLIGPAVIRYQEGFGG
ncbi:MAG: type II secretion system F family protein [Acidimicrobiales bacterium]